MRILSLVVVMLTTLSLPLFSAFALADVKPVDVFYPDAETHQQTLLLSGSVEAVQHAQLASLQNGRVESLKVDVGDEVEAGQALLVLDATLAELALDEAKAALEVAKVNLKEAQRLYQELVNLSKQQLVAQTLLAERRAQFASAKAEVMRQRSTVALQQETVNRHTLYAPFTGIISARSADLGEWVTPQTSVLTLVQHNQLRLKIAIPQQYYALVSGKKHVAVNIIPDVTGMGSIHVQMSRLVAVSDPQNRTLTAFVNLPASSGLIAGMSANAEVILPDSQQPLVWLPKTAIKRHPDGGSSVFAVNNNKVQRVLVEIVEQRNDKVAIFQNTPGRGYVVSGVELLQDGADVSVNVVKGDAL